MSCWAAPLVRLLSAPLTLMRRWGEGGAGGRDASLGSSVSLLGGTPYA